VAVYFRDLENGPGFSIHEDALFSPASMLKLPMLISILKESEHNPSLLSQQITLAEIPDIDSPAVFPAPPLEVHRPYTVEELLRAMIIHSDNVSLFVLGALLQQLYPTEDLLADTLTEMGIAKSEQTVEDFLTVKRYSSFYRALYNASFLSKEKSQAALNMLSATTFKEGIMAGLPQGTVVAHKFGERDGKQLHDCGIVYHPRTPYLLCIMTKGSSIPALLDIIRTLSHDVYAEVDSRP
jgi:beta-lactamase class A